MWKHSISSRFKSGSVLVKNSRITFAKEAQYCKNLPYKTTTQHSFDYMLFSRAGKSNHGCSTSRINERQENVGPYPPIDVENIFTNINKWNNYNDKLFETKSYIHNNHWVSMWKGTFNFTPNWQELKSNSRYYCTSRYSSLSSSFTYEYKFESTDGIIMRFNLVKLKALNSRKPKLVNILLLEFTMVEDTFPYKDAKRFSISPLEAALILDLNDDEEMTLTRNQSTDPKTGEVTRPSRSISFYIPKPPRQKTVDIVVSEADPLTGEERIWGNLNLDRGRAALFRHLIQFSIPKLIENETETLIESINPLTIPRPENAPF